MTLATDESSSAASSRTCCPKASTASGLLANGNRAANLAKARDLLEVPAAVAEPKPVRGSEAALRKPKRAA